ncbi:MAG: ATP-binding cassette domain-containing protein [Flavobacteriaceae bacterium]
MATLQLYKAKKSFGKNEVLKEVSFKVKTGEILGVFGRNGCGKSTLLKLIFGTLKATEIDLRLDNVSVNPLKLIPKKKIAYLPQHSFLPRNSRVRDIVPIYFPSQEKQDCIFYDSQIALITSKKVSELSIGQLRYFQVLLIGNLERDFLLFDEPFSMIDPLYKAKISELLIELQQHKGIIITDHYYEDVLNITSKNILLKDGISHSISSKEDLISSGYISKK